MLSKLKTPEAFCFRPGWILRDRAEAKGGVYYYRELIDEQLDGDRLVSDHKTRKTVDNVTFVAEADALVKKVHYVLRKHCTRTELGWFADDACWAKVKAEVAILQDEAVDINRRAKAARSERQVTVNVVPLRLDLVQPEVVREIATTIRGIMVELLTTLRSGDITPIHKLKIRSRNLEQLAVGIQADVIRFALDRAWQAASEIKQAMDAAPASATQRRFKLAQEVGRSLDLEMIEAAIEHFTVRDTETNFEKEIVSYA